ncbi:MAG: NTP transferase domain-containing protein [Blastochloris sp.]|nr:NTP transferase domain-containing protein [Blastochloris sp.]
MRTVATIEARMGSTRLPGKVLANISGRPALEVMIERLRLVPELDDIVIATTTAEADCEIDQLANRVSVRSWRGSEDDVLCRVLDAATAHQADVIVELTGDLPLIDPAIVSRVVQLYRHARVDYASNVLTRTYPIGMDTQVFSCAVLADVARRTDDATDREHVSLYIYKHPEIYSLANVPAPPEETRPDLRLTLDTAEDLTLIRTVHAALAAAEGPGFPLSSMLAFLDARPDIAAINAAVPHRWV